MAPVQGALKTTWPTQSVALRSAMFPFQGKDHSGSLKAEMKWRRASPCVAVIEIDQALQGRHISIQTLRARQTVKILQCAQG